jgi:hypothetical protein
MEFLGRPVLAGSGAARLATELRVPIFPIYARQTDAFQHLEVGEPIEPAGISDFTQIQAEIGRRHEAAVLAWPEAVESPLNRWRPGDPADALELGYSEERLATLVV